MIARQGTPYVQHQIDREAATKYTRQDILCEQNSGLLRRIDGGFRSSIRSISDMQINKATCVK